MDKLLCSILLSVLFVLPLSAKDLQQNTSENIKITNNEEILNRMALIRHGIISDNSVNALVGNNQNNLDIFQCNPNFYTAGTMYGKGSAAVFTTPYTVNGTTYILISNNIIAPSRNIGLGLASGIFKLIQPSPGYYIQINSYMQGRRTRAQAQLALITVVDGVIQDLQPLNASLTIPANNYATAQNFNLSNCYSCDEDLQFGFIVASDPNDLVSCGPCGSN